MRKLSEQELIKAAELLEIIVRPGEDESGLGRAIEEGQKLFGYYKEPPVVRTRGRRSFYGIHVPK